MFPFSHTYADALEGTYVPWKPATPRQPALVFLNEPLATELGLDRDALRAVAVRQLSGAEVPEGARPLAQAYAGHQFGGLSPQLGDGRALLLGELVDTKGQRRDVQLKGSGRTPFSRGGDGKAALGPMLREVIVGEALHALGVPTSRALAVTTTGETIFRETPLPGAVLTRVAASHLRVGTFEFFAIRDDLDHLGRLVTYALDRHHPGADRTNPALGLLTAVRDAQARLVASWMGVGFLHGVLNTDNVAISGESIDFGPCAFLDAHDPDAVFSSIDAQGRYAYGNQPTITAWNLARLASALLPLIDPDEDKAVRAAQAVLDGFAAVYDRAWNTVLRQKLGLVVERPGDELLLEAASLLLERGPDHTGFFRALVAAARGDDAPLLALFERPEPAEAWVGSWRRRATDDLPPRDLARFLAVTNPRVIPRNHKVEEALEAATEGDLLPFEALLAAVRRPFDDDPALDPYASPAPPAFTASYRTFCGT